MKRRRAPVHIAQGAVKWFSNESGYGFIHPDDGGQNLLVRRGYMVGGEFESPKKGDRVTYDVTQGAKGLWAMNVSKT
jgi:CspA family cold shock protein